MFEFLLEIYSSAGCLIDHRLSLINSYHVVFYQQINICFNGPEIEVRLINNPGFIGTMLADFQYFEIIACLLLFMMILPHDPAIQDNYGEHYLDNMLNEQNLRIRFDMDFKFLLQILIEYATAKWYGWHDRLKIWAWNIDYISLYAFRSFNVGNSRTIFHFDKLYIWLSHPLRR